MSTTPFDRKSRDVDPVCRALIAPGRNGPLLAAHYPFTHAAGERAVLLHFPTQPLCYWNANRIADEAPSHTFLDRPGVCCCPVFGKALQPLCIADVGCQQSSFRGNPDR